MYTFIAEDALGMFEAIRLHQGMDVDSHRTGRRATVARHARIGLFGQLESRGLQLVADKASNHHERRDPTDVVTGCAFANQQAVGDEDRQHAIIYDVHLWLRYRNATGDVVERFQCPMAKTEPKQSHQ